MANKLSSLLQPCSLPHISLVTGRVSWLIRKKNKSWMLPRSPLQRTSWSSDMKGGAPRPSEGFYHLKPTDKKLLILGRIDLFLALNLTKITSRKGESHVHVAQTRRGTSRNANGWLVGKRHGGKQQTNKPPAKIYLPKKNLACPKNW